MVRSSFFLLSFFKKMCTSKIFFFFWQNIVCFSFLTVHTRYITIMCLQKESGKENIHESPKCIKLNRSKNKWSEKIKKTVNSQWGTISFFQRKLKKKKFFSQVKAAGNQALVYYWQHLVTVSLHLNTGPFCNFWVLFLISSCWEKSQPFLFVKLLVIMSRSNTAFSYCCRQVDLVGLT